jgi:hypothetical protein
VKNTRGEEVEGISLTAEAPPRLEGTEAHSTGISSVPWPGELIERETGKKQLLIHHAKYWMVLPPPNVGNGPGCLGTEIEFEEQEGASEKEAGDELAPLWVNGSKNGLKNSWMELDGQTGKTEKGFPITGRLISPTAGPGYFKAFPLLVGGLGGAWELITAE